jgi:exonuclease SbcC
LKKLAEHDKVLPLQVDYNKWMNAKLVIKTLIKSIEFNNSILLSKQTEKRELLNSVSKKMNDTLNEDNFNEKLDNFVSKVTLIDNEIIEIKGSLNSKVEGLNTLLQQIPAASIVDISSFQKSVFDLNSFIQKKDAELSNIKLPSGYDGTEYGDLIDKLTEQNTVLFKAINLKSDIDDLNKSRNTELNSKEEFEKAFKENSDKLKDFKDLTEKLQTELDEAQNLFSANQTLMSLEEYRDLLVEGEPCPCCGSKEHPFATKKPKLNNKLEENLKVKKLELENNNKKITSFEKVLIEIGTNISSTQKNIKNIDADIVDKLELYNSHCNNFGLPLKIEVDDLSANLFENEKKKNILSKNNEEQPIISPNFNFKGKIDSKALG